MLAMMLLLIIVLTAGGAIVATVRAVLRDGYRHRPTEWHRVPDMRR